MELRGADSSHVQTGTERLELSGVASSQMDVRGVVIGRAAEGVSVFQSGVAGLDSLLRERNVATRDCVQVRLGVSVSDSRFAQFDGHGDLREVEGPLI